MSFELGGNVVGSLARIGIVNCGGTRSLNLGEHGSGGTNSATEAEAATHGDTCAYPERPVATCQSVGDMRRMALIGLMRAVGCWPGADGGAQGDGKTQHIESRSQIGR